MNKSTLSKVWQDPAYFIAFGFGTGLLPFMPGTWGSLAALPLYLILMQLSPLYYLLFVCCLFGIGYYVADKVSLDLGIDDFSGIVCDEIVGMLLTLWAVPLGIGWFILGFLLFRLFDIIKPWPIRAVEDRVKGGLGIMLDDILAAIPACAILHLLAWFLA